MKVISILGRKGGSGKTQISHLISHGMSRFEEVKACALLMTDVREPNVVELLPNRDYIVAAVPHDDSQGTKLTKIFGWVESVPNSLIVVDGGANRRNIDLFYLAVSDLILIPTGFSKEELRLAELDYREFSEAIANHPTCTAEVFIIPNRWPGEARKRRMVESKPWVQEYMGKFKANGWLFPYYIPDMPSFMELTDLDDPKSTLRVDSIAKSTAELIGYKLGILSYAEGNAVNDSVSSADTDEEEEERVA